jgi:hypothetical protein
MNSAGEKPVSEQYLPQSSGYTERWTTNPMVLMQKPFQLIPDSSLTDNQRVNVYARVIIALSVARLLTKQANQQTVLLQGLAALVLSALANPDKGLSLDTHATNNLSRSEEEHKYNMYDPRNVYINTGILGQPTEEDIDVSLADRDRMTMNPREAPGRQSIRVSNNAHVYATRPPQHYYRDSMGLEANTAGVDKFVSKPYYE